MKKVAGAAALIVAAAALLVACGGGSDKPNADTTPTAPPASNRDFSKTFAKLAKQSFKVTYTDAGGATVVFAQDGKGNTVTAGDDKQVFTTPTTAITCEKPENTTEFACTQRPINLGADSNYIAPSLAEKTYATALAYRFRNTSSRKIAERDSDCFSITGTDFEGAGGIAGAAGSSLKGTATYCNDRETGALMTNTVTSEEGETTTQLLVTKFEEPTAADFEPPAVPSVATVPGGPITVPGGVSPQ